jgi:hypothetical protein
MDLNGRILSYTNIYSQWLSKGSTESAAIELTLQQVDALEEIAESDDFRKRQEQGCLAGC